MKNLKNILPKIKRTRGYLLYDTRGKRYLDLYQDAGRAILGHRLDGISGIIKSTVSRGLTAAYPSVYPERLDKQLKMLFPDVKEFRVYGNIERAVKMVASATGTSLEAGHFTDFPSKECRFALWRPFIDNSSIYNFSEYFIPVLPMVGSYGPVVVCSNSDAVLHHSDLLSPMFYDILIKSISSLQKNVVEVDPEKWELPESRVWKRVGPYLRFRLHSQEYSSLFSKALGCGVILPPAEKFPGIVPLRYETGQIKAFMNMIRSDYGTK